MEKLLLTGGGGEEKVHLNWPRRVLRSGYVDIEDKVLLNLAERFSNLAFRTLLNYCSLKDRMEFPKMPEPLSERLLFHKKSNE